MTDVANTNESAKRGRDPMREEGDPPTLTGRVVGDKMNKDGHGPGRARVKHALYGKVMTRTASTTRMTRTTNQGRRSGRDRGVPQARQDQAYRVTRLIEKAKVI